MQLHLQNFDKIQKISVLCTSSCPGG